MNKIILIFISIILTIAPTFLLADDLEDLGELAEETQTSSSTETPQLGVSKSSVASPSNLSFSVGGYVKALGYWNEERYSDELWNNYYANYAAMGYDTPAEQEMSGYNNIGSKMQLKLEAFLDDRARLFSAFNVGFNAAQSLHDSTSDSSSPDSGEIQLVESFVEIYLSSTTFKVGSQLVTWGYMEGFEVPTDRVNARDYSLKSTEYEDSKLPSTGLLLTQNLWSTYLDVMFIPLARTNKGMEFREYFYPEDTETIEYEPDKSKWATRFYSSIGDLDFALSYVEGLDPEPDLIPSTLIATGINASTGEITYTVSPTGKQYNRVRSPGLDLQYNLGSVLAKASYVKYWTEDDEGDDIFIKNNWSKYLVGAEFNLGGSTINLYAGQQLVDDFQDDNTSTQTNFLLGQLRERTDFVSGHINASFLTGDALNLILLGAGYWDEDGKQVQSNLKATVTYKVANGLELVLSYGYMDLLDNIFVDNQFEVKYSF